MTEIPDYQRLPDFYPIKYVYNILIQRSYVITCQETAKAFWNESSVMWLMTPLRESLELLALLMKEVGGGWTR